MKTNANGRHGDSFRFLVKGWMNCVFIKALFSTDGHSVTANRIFLLCLCLLSVGNMQAKVGVRVGLNFATQQLKSDYGLEVTELTGFQIGGVYQYAYIPRRIGVGCETGVLFTQRGCVFANEAELIKGYNELNYAELPLNLRFLASFGPVGVYAYAGLYGSCLLQAKSIRDGESEDAKLQLGTFEERLDYGYSAGAGIEVLQRFQLGVSWNDGLKDIATVYKDTGLKVTSAENRMLSVNLLLLF